jgi:hypothetical protein
VTEAQELALTVPHTVAYSEGVLAAESESCADSVEAALAESAPVGVADRDAEAQRVAVGEMEKVAVVEGELVTEGELVVECVWEEEAVPLGVIRLVPEELGVWLPPMEPEIVAEEETVETTENDAREDAVTEAHEVPVNDTVTVADTDAEPVIVADGVADRL